MDERCGASGGRRHVRNSQGRGENTFNYKIKIKTIFALFLLFAINLSLSELPLTLVINT